MTESGPQDVVATGGVHLTSTMEGQGASFGSVEARKVSHVDEMTVLGTKASLDVSQVAAYHRTKHASEAYIAVHPLLRHWVLVLPQGFASFMLS